MKIGYQLYSALELCQTEQGLRDTICKIAQMGYDGVEFFSYVDMSAAQVRQLLADNGIEGLNAHVQLSQWQTSLDEEIEYAVQAGVPMITIPYIAPADRTAELYSSLRQSLPAWVEKCKKNGIKACYHNHEFEYETIDGQLVLDIFAQASPLLYFELDTFWAMYAGLDPVAELEKRKNQLGAVHIKDYLNKTTSPPTFCAVGHGKMDVCSIIEKSKQLDIDWLVVEQDNSQIDALESAKLSLDFIRQYL